MRANRQSKNHKATVVFSSGFRHSGSIKCNETDAFFSGVSFDYTEFVSRRLKGEPRIIDDRRRYLKLFRFKALSSKTQLSAAAKKRETRRESRNVLEQSPTSQNWPVQLL